MSVSLPDCRLHEGREGSALCIPPLFVPSSVPDTGEHSIHFCQMNESMSKWKSRHQRCSREGELILREEVQIGIGPMSAEKPKDSQHLVGKALGLSPGFAYRHSPPVMPT